VRRFEIHIFARIPSLSARCAKFSHIALFFPFSPWSLPPSPLKEETKEKKVLRKREGEGKELKSEKG
jgi:hypothetical protein